MSGPDGDASDALDDLVRRAGIRAAEWRGEGIGKDLDRPVHPPAQSALLAMHLSSYLGTPLEPRPVPSSLKGRIAEKLLGHERARTDRLYEYAALSTEDLARAICRLEVELAELRARVGLLEDQAAVRRSAEGQS